MRIFNATKTIEMMDSQCDLTKGYLKPEKLIIGERPSIKEEKVNADGTRSITTYQTTAIEEDILVYIPYTQKELYIKEKEQLEFWFQTEYRETFEKCTRRMVLGKTLRDGSDPSVKLNELYANAEINANRIHELELLINTLN